MQGQYLQHGSATPTARLFFYNTADGTPATVPFNAASLALVYARDNGSNTALTLVTATLGTWVSSGFISRGGGVHDLYLPTAAALTGAKSLTITSTGLPTGVSMNPCVIPLGADDIAAAAATDATIATAVDAAVADNFTAIPGAVRTNLAVELARIDVAVSSVSGGGGGGASTAAITTAVLGGLAGAEGIPARTAIGVSVDAALADNFAAIPAAPSAASNAAAVEAALLDNFDALPTAAEIAAAVAAPSAGTIAAAVAAPSAAAIAAAVAAPSASAIASAVAAPSAGTIATTVRGALAPDFAAIPVPPTASQVSTQTVADLAGVPGLPARAAIADKLLLRNHEGGDDSGRSVSSTLAANRNRVERSGNTITVYRADDVTILYTAVITTDAALLPVSGINPA